MAISGVKQAILVDEYRFASYTNQLETQIEVIEENATTLDSAAEEYAPTLSRMRIRQMGYFDGVDADGIEAELKARLGVGSVTVAHLVGTADTNCPAYILPNASGAEMKITAPVKGLLALEGSWITAGTGTRGLRVFTGTISGTGNQTAVDFASAGSAGGTVYLFVHGITGTATNAEVRLQSATTQGGSYSDEATITFSAVGVATAALSGTVNRWLRTSTIDMGGATDFTVTAIAVVSGVTA